MLKRVSLLVLIASSLLAICPGAQAQSSSSGSSSSAAHNPCAHTVNLIQVPTTVRAGFDHIIWKSNSDSLGRELGFSQGNHSQAGPAILVYYTSRAAIYSATQLYDMNNRLMTTFGPRPRCYVTGCGVDTRAYSRGPGGGRLTVPQIWRLAKRAFAPGECTHAHCPFKVRIGRGYCAIVPSAYTQRAQLHITF